MQKYHTAEKTFCAYYWLHYCVGYKGPDGTPDFTQAAGAHRKTNPSTVRLHLWSQHRYALWTYGPPSLSVFHYLRIMEGRYLCFSQGFHCRTWPWPNCRPQILTLIWNRWGFIVYKSWGGGAKYNLHKSIQFNHLIIKGNLNIGLQVCLLTGTPMYS